MAQSPSPKTTLSKFVDAMFAAKHFHQFKTNNLLLGHDSSARLYISDYTLALEDITELHRFPGRCLIFKNVRGVPLLVAVVRR